MSYSDLLTSLTVDDRKKFVDALAEIGLTEEKAESLLKFKVILEGTNFHGTITGDLAHALWKLQVAYYRFVAFSLYGDPSATLSAKEKEKFLLVFNGKNGSSEIFEDLSDSLLKIADRAFDKMEGWQILLAIIALAAAYGGAKFLSYLKDKKALQIDANKHSEDVSVMKEMIKSHEEIFLSAWDAGLEGRKAILKNVSGLDRAQIGDKNYSKEDIDSLRKRATRISAKTETKVICVAVEDIDTRIKSHPIVTLHEKDTENRFKADFVQNYDDETELTEALDLIWNSARYADRYFWAEVSIVSRREKIVNVSILNVADEESDLLEPLNEDEF